LTENLDRIMMNIDGKISRINSENYFLSVLSFCLFASLFGVYQYGMMMI